MAGSGSGWTSAAYRTAVAYENDVWLTYTVEIPNAEWDAGAKLFGATCSDQVTPETRASCIDAAIASIYQPIESAVANHLAYMRNHPAARCFADAYTTDRGALSAYMTAARDLQRGDNSGWDSWIEKADKASQTFLKRFGGYFSDCR